MDKKKLKEEIGRLLQKFGLTSHKVEVKTHNGGVIYVAITETIK